MSSSDNAPVEIDSRRPPKPEEKQAILAANHPAFTAAHVTRSRAEAVIAAYTSLEQSAVELICVQFNMSAPDVRRLIELPR